MVQVFPPRSGAIQPAMLQPVPQNELEDAVSSLAEVARRAGVSKATASRALSGAAHVSADAKERVAAAASDLGYVVSSTASSLVTGRTKNVGVITPFINRWFFAEVLEGIEGALIREGYDLTLFRLPAEPEQRSRLFHYFLVRKRVDAIVCVGVALTPSEVELIHTLRRPAVGTAAAVSRENRRRVGRVAAGASSAMAGRNAAGVTSTGPSSAAVLRARTLHVTECYRMLPNVTDRADYTRNCTSRAQRVSVRKVAHAASRYRQGG